MFELMTDLKYSAFSISCGRSSWANCHGDTRFTKSSHTAPVNSRVRICDAAHDPFHLSLNQDGRARRSPFAIPSVATWFQIDIDSCAFRKPTCLFECQYFCVLDSIVAVKALAHDDPILNNDSTHKRVRLYLTFTLGRECKSEIQKIKIEISPVIDSHILGHDFHSKIHQQIRAQQSSAST